MTYKVSDEVPFDVFIMTADGGYGEKILTVDAVDADDADNKAPFYLFWLSPADSKFHTDHFGIFEHAIDAEHRIREQIITKVSK